MHTDSIIKLIGDRPVYRVDQSRLAALFAFEERIERLFHRAPVIDRKQWNRPMSGSEISKPETGWLMECHEGVGSRF
jgi:hypothetical protein